MTNGQPTGPDSSMEDSGGVSGMVNLTVNLPDNLRLVPVDSDEEEETEVASAIVTGSIIAFAGGTAPSGWLLCNGAAISRATYADLFAVIGTDYGVGNANTTFNLPDLRGRFPLGLDNMGQVSADRVAAAEADELGGSGGMDTITLTPSQLPEHHHSLLMRDASSPGTNPHEDSEFADNVWESVADHSRGENYPRYTKRTPHISRDAPIVYDAPNAPYLVAAGGEGLAHDNMPPFQTLNYIIKT